VNVLYERPQLHTQSFYNPVSIRIVSENSAPIDAPADDVMQGTQRIYSGLTWYKFFNINKKEARNVNPIFHSGRKWG